MIMCNICYLKEIDIKCEKCKNAQCVKCLYKNDFVCCYCSLKFNIFNYIFDTFDLNAIRFVEKYLFDKTNMLANKHFDYIKKIYYLFSEWAVNCNLSASEFIRLNNQFEKILCSLICNNVEKIVESLKFLLSFTKDFFIDDKEMICFTGSSVYSINYDDIYEKEIVELPVECCSSQQNHKQFKVFEKIGDVMYISENYKNERDNLIISPFIQGIKIKFVDTEKNISEFKLEKNFFDLEFENSYLKLEKYTRELLSLFSFFGFFICKTRECNALRLFLKTSLQTTSNCTCNKLNCDFCNTLYCKYCLSSSDHHETCDVKKSIDNIMMCPNCKCLVFKDFGCDDMWCINCETFFSWNTGRILLNTPHNPDYMDNVVSNLDDHQSSVVQYIINSIIEEDNGLLNIDFFIIKYFLQIRKYEYFNCFNEIRYFVLFNILKHVVTIMLLQSEIIAEKVTLKQISYCNRYRQIIIFLSNESTYEKNWRFINYDLLLIDTKKAVFVYKID